MKKKNQILILILFILGTLSIIIPLFLFNIIPLPNTPKDIGTWVVFGLIWFLMINEGLNWVKNGKRSDWADIVIIIFLFISVFLVTQDLFTSFIGAFSIYLLFGIFELKEYEILNKILLITVITYNVIFFTGILDTIFKKEGVWRDTAFSLSFWLMLILGFAFFGRKYMIVFRFMSPTYLTLALYLIAWSLVVSVTKFTPLNLMDYIYFILILTNIVVYTFSGPLLDLMMGYKKIDNPVITSMVEEIALKLNINPKKIKIRYGKYPILNAMAYGAFWNMHMAIISPTIDSIPEDELKGIVAHEIGHLKHKHTLSLTLISSVQILIFWFLKWPVTMYDYTFNPDQPFPMWVFLLLSFVLSIFIYVFIRFFESQADLTTRRAGYSYQLAKGLYNLESFYASSHEVGLDATLLSDEKETENNQLLRYLSTATYLNNNIINPSKGTLLSNLINSHPPSYHRIMASLNEDEISTKREALMPFTFLKKKKAREFFLETQSARMKYMELATQKIKTKFKVDDIKVVMKNLKKEDEINHKIGKTYAFLNLKTHERIFGRIEKIFFEDNAAEPVRYEIHDLLNHTKNQNQNQNQKEDVDQKNLITINPYIHKEIPIALNEDYNFRKEGTLHLRDIKINEIYHKPNKKKKKKKETSEFLAKNTGVLIFKKSSTDLKSDNNNLGDDLIKKPIFDTKIPRSLQYIQEFTNKYVYIRHTGSYQVRKLEKVDKNICLTIIDEKTGKKEIIKKSEYVYKNRRLFFPIHFDDQTIKLEKNFLKYLQTKSIRAHFLLKKAVNSQINGIIREIDNIDKKFKNIKDSKDKIILHIDSLFDEKVSISLNKIDGIIIDTPCIIIEKKSKISFFSKFINKIVALRHPEKIYL